MRVIRVGGRHPEGAPDHREELVFLLNSANTLGVDAHALALQLGFEHAVAVARELQVNALDPVPQLGIALGALLGSRIGR